MRVVVRFAGTNHTLDVEAGSKVDALCEELQDKTGVLARNQKLIYKGKVLERGGALSALLPGAKLMLLASDSGAETAGQAAAREAAGAKAAAVASRVATQQQQQKAGGSGSGAAAAGKGVADAPATACLAQRAAGWAKTGVVALRGEGLAELPAAALEASASVRVLDVTANAFVALPNMLSRCTMLQQLHAPHNKITSGGLPWHVLAALPQLSALTLGGNCLDELPGAVSGLSSLTLLALEGNALRTLPPGVGHLARLRALSVRGNRLAALPPELTGCTALLELDASSNALTTLPQGLGALSLLRSLQLDNNRLATLPAELLHGCTSLCTLGVHGNPITAEQLRELDGFAEYDDRRRAKHDKQIGLHILGTRFDEGADVTRWDHWAAAIHKNRPPGGGSK